MKGLERDVGTPLFRRHMHWASANLDDRGALEFKVWSGTPYMVEAYVGSQPLGGPCPVMVWCDAKFGRPRNPFNGTPGAWRAGNGIVHGWQWFGFAKEADMEAFAAAHEVRPSW